MTTFSVGSQEPVPARHPILNSKSLDIYVDQLRCNTDGTRGLEDQVIG